MQAVQSNLVACTNTGTYPEWGKIVTGSFLLSLSLSLSLLLFNCEEMLCRDDRQQSAQ